MHGTTKEENKKIESFIRLFMHMDFFSLCSAPFFFFFFTSPLSKTPPFLVHLIATKNNSHKAD